jgi:hypothetical protein
MSRPNCDRCSDAPYRLYPMQRFYVRVKARKRLPPEPWPYTDRAIRYGYRWKPVGWLCSQCGHTLLDELPEALNASASLW